MTLFCVSVPVLSVHRISIAPKFWMALSLFTMHFRRAITTAPLARLVVTIIGSISGVSPTATETANSSDSSQSPLVIPLMRSTSGVITSKKRINIQLTRLMPLSKLVSGRAPAMSFATAEIGGIAGCHHDDDCCAAHHVCSHEAGGFLFQKIT